MVTQENFLTFAAGTSFLHRLPAWIKIMFLLATGPAVMLSPAVVWIPFSMLTAAAAMSCGQTRKGIPAAAKAYLAYFLIFYMASLISGISGGVSGTEFPAVLIPAKNDILQSARLFSALLSASAVYTTTSPVQIAETIGKTAAFMTEKGKTAKPGTAAVSLSLLLVMIPAVFDVWNEVSAAWKARGGKNGIRKAVILMPVFLNLCLDKADRISDAARNRSS